MTDYHRIPEFPKEVSATAILTRMFDGLGFRFNWATHGLSEPDYQFRPSPDSMSIHEVTHHVWGLVNWVSISLTGVSYPLPNESEAFREAALGIIHDLHVSLESMSDEELSGKEIEGKPFWYMINGPISDALTHVGQINSFRRLAGNPTPGANVFIGEPPK